MDGYDSTPMPNDRVEKIPLVVRRYYAHLEWSYGHLAHRIYPSSVFTSRAFTASERWESGSNLEKGSADRNEHWSNNHLWTLSGHCPGEGPSLTVIGCVWERIGGSMEPRPTIVANHVGQCVKTAPSWKSFHGYGLSFFGAGAPQINQLARCSG